MSSRNTLSLKEIDGELVPEEMTYQARIRAAVFDGVTEADAKAVVQKIVEKAKAGDEKAQRMFLDYLAGFGASPTKITVVQNYGSVAEAAEAERARSGAKSRQATPKCRQGE
jgi:hypothetical protein